MDQNQSSPFGSLRPMVDDDLEMVLAWRNNPNVRNNMYSQQEITLADHRRWWAKTKNSLHDRYFIYEAKGGPSGLLAFNEIDQSHEVAFWGFYTSPEAPKGTGTGLGLAALDYGFGELGLHKLCAEVLAYNAASLAFHRKLGFVEEGVFVAQKKINGTFVDVYRLAAFAVNWGEKRLALATRLSKRI